MCYKKKRLNDRTPEIILHYNEELFVLITDFCNLKRRQNNYDPVFLDFQVQFIQKKIISSLSVFCWGL